MSIHIHRLVRLVSFPYVYVFIFVSFYYMIDVDEFGYFVMSADPNAKLFEAHHASSKKKKKNTDTVLQDR